jgi:quercetin dioxygenase-like cupin family protein
MKNTIRYYPKEELQMKPAVSGAKMWGVSLENTLLTYFEVEPNSSFETHSHESEQITMVLEGELFFEVDDDVICVEPGEVIAIPSMEPHAAFTKEKPVKAVDAWSPVMEKYK